MTCCIVLPFLADELVERVHLSAQPPQLPDPKPTGSADRLSGHKLSGQSEVLLARKAHSEDHKAITFNERRKRQEGKEQTD